VVTTVTFQSELYDVFSDKTVVDLDSLGQDLSNYFSDYSKIPYLGKDTPFERPDNIRDVELHHIHLYVDTVSCLFTWNQKSTSDSYIVYTYGFMNEDAYHIIDIIGDDAHRRCRDFSLMRKYKYLAEHVRARN
jgi:hypothetical protein